MKKEIIKSCIKILFILLVAVVSTYYIYHKFQNDRDVDFNSESLNVVFHDTSMDKIQLLKVTPVTDSVGLSSSSYSFDVTNNLTINNNYQVRIIIDEDKIKEDECSDILIPEDEIRISVRVGKEENQLYNLSDLENGVLLTRMIPALKKDSVSIRVWVNKDSKLPAGSTMHYHGIIQVVEGENIIASIE